MIGTAEKVENSTSDCGKQDGFTDLEKPESDSGSVDLSGEFRFGVDYGERRSSVFGTSMNTVSTIIGAGVLSLPYTVSETGYVAGVVLFFVGAIATQWGLYLVSLTRKVWSKLFSSCETT